MRLPARQGRASLLEEDRMPLFICTLTWTDHGIKSIDGISRRRDLARNDVADAFDVEVKEILYTSGDTDILYILKAEDEEAVAKWAMFIGSRGFVRTRIARAFTKEEFDDILNEVFAHLEERQS
jgi:uncharacterized protein with GYD domain